MERTVALLWWLVEKQTFVDGAPTAEGGARPVTGRFLKVDLRFSVAWAPWSECGANLLRHVASGPSAEATFFDRSMSMPSDDGQLYKSLETPRT